MCEINLLNIPESLETERLILRCPMPGDGVLVNEALRESWPELTRWMNWAKGDVPDVADSERRQQQNRVAYLERDEFHFNLFLKETGQFVGKPSLLRMDKSVPKGEIGYWIRTSLVGRGLMTEAVAAITEFAFEALHLVRVEIRCDALNRRSAAIPERLGYRLEGKLINDCRAPQGDLRDTEIYARTRPVR